MTARTVEVAVFAGVRGPARTFSYLVPAGLDLLPGHLVRVGLGARAVPGVVISLDGAPAARELRAVDALVHPLPLLRPHQLALASWIAKRYRCGLADAVRAMVPPALASRARSPGLAAARGERTEAVFALGPAGRDALAGSVRVGARQLLTLRALAAGAVTSGDRVALRHSALSAGERFDEWRRILDGVADVVVGSRSALFAPLERVGLVVVDEEQEPSYKQESDPRYHAVDAALELGHITGAAVVLGSATPRVVTYEAARKGELVPLALPERVAELPLPPTTVVDLRLELRTGNRGTLSQALRDALQRTVAAGGQAILYLNRRGFATVVLCRDCGYVAKCPACEIPYAYHLDGALG